MNEMVESSSIIHALPSIKGLNSILLVDTEETKDKIYTKDSKWSYRYIPNYPLNS